MKLRLTERLRRSYEAAPLQVQKAFDKQARLLVQGLRHPSLRAKKYDEARDIWQARVTEGWRFYFRIEGDLYHLTDMMPHPK